MDGWIGEGEHDKGIIDRNVIMTTMTVMLLTCCLLGTSHCEGLLRDDLMKFGRLVDKVYENLDVFVGWCGGCKKEKKNAAEKWE